MKKFLSLFAVAAILLPIACNKNDDKTDVVDLNKRIAQESETWKFDIDDNELVDLGEGVGKPTGAEKTDGNQIIITTQEKVGDNIENHVFTGPCTRIDENKFEMVDERTQGKFGLEIQTPKSSGYSVTITYKGKTYTAFATPKGELTSNPVLLAAIARVFTVLETTVAVELPGNDKLAGGKTFTDGCNIPSIVSWMKEAGVEFDFDPTGYVVKNIEFTTRGTVIIRFTGQDPYEGEMVQIKDDNTFEYELNVKDEKENPVFSGKANGKVIVNYQKGRVTVVLDATGKTSKDETYKASVTLNVAPAK